MDQPALIIFVKNPIPGKTKTRLAASVGDEMALRMYGILTAWTREQTQQLPGVTRYLYYSDQIDQQDAWPAADFSKRLQQGAGLGERMRHALEEVAAAGHRRTIIIGTDCPGVTTPYLRTAFQQLIANDVVIGPALDGGYTLLGIAGDSIPDLFSGVAWSSETVLAQTIVLAKAAGKTFTQLPALSDVDYLEDWYSYGWTLPT